MSATSLISSLYQYKAWANEALFSRFEAIDQQLHASQCQAMLRILNHIYVVDRIFAGHLTNTPHGYSGTNTPDTPELEQLHQQVKESDRWFVQYCATLSAPELEQSIEFTFTDGQPGRMTREEMLAHVVTHGGYHRGAVGRMLTQIQVSPPRDVFTGFLHQSQPERRSRGLM